MSFYAAARLSFVDSAARGEQREPSDCKLTGLNALRLPRKSRISLREQRGFGASKSGRQVERRRSLPASGLVKALSLRQPLL